MLKLIVFLIFTLPVVEIFGIVLAIREFGFANAFFFWIAATILGFGILRTSGLRLTVGVAQAVREGKPPAAAALDTAFVGLAGVLFLIPGYVTDALAFVLLIAPLRKWLSRRIARNLVRSPSSGGFEVDRDRRAETDASSMVIDVDATVIDPEPGGNVSENRRTF